jgi:hypothetical protein
MRPEIAHLVSKGPLPNSSGGIQQIKEWQEALENIQAPLSDEEAEAVAALFPTNDDDCFGLAWSLIYLVETSPSWLLQRCPQETENPWISRLRLRCS